MGANDIEGASLPIAESSKILRNSLNHNVDHNVIKTHIMQLSIKVHASRL